MTNDDRNLTPESIPGDDDLRYAPPLADSQSEADPVVAEAEVQDEAAFVPAETEMPPPTGAMDIEAALAAVSTLSDMLAEQEAAEQARLAQLEAEAQAAAERRARLEHPEQFFPVPPLTVLRRGQMASVVPALLLMLIGAWLTFTLTTTKTLPNGGLLIGVGVGALGLTLLARWLASGRWSRGTLFWGLVALLAAAVVAYLVQPVSPGLAAGWPLLLLAPGAAFILTAWLAYPPDRRLILPGILLIVSGAAGLVVTLGIVDATITATLSTLWPVALALVVFVWLLPVAFKRRR